MKKSKGCVKVGDKMTTATGRFVSTPNVQEVPVPRSNKPESQPPGNLIVFEGIDGTGKGTMLEMLYKRVEEEGMVDWVRYPSNEDPIDLQIREMLFKDPGSHEIDAAAIDALFLAGHLHRTNKVIWPTLNEGRHVVCDRYWQSAVVYPIERDGGERIAMLYPELDWPRTSLFVLLTCDPKIAFERANKRGDGKQEAKTWNKLEMQTRMQRHFLRLFGDRKSTLVVDTTHIEPRFLFDNIVWPKVRALLTPIVENDLRTSTSLSEDNMNLPSRAFFLWEDRRRRKEVV